MNLLWALLIAAAIIGLIIWEVCWWCTETATFTCNSNHVIAYRRTRYQGDLYSILKKYTVRCGRCGWEIKLDGYDFRPDLVEKRYGGAWHARRHVCPTLDETLDELIKNLPTWEGLK